MLLWYDNRNETSPLTQGQRISSNETLFHGRCPYWDIAGDGYCNDEANIEHCGYDLNDCCQMEKDRTLCSNCTCLIAKDKTQSIQSEFFDEFCPENETRYLWFLGDGQCQLNLNTGTKAYAVCYF